jgi:hypothetical protein
MQEEDTMRSASGRLTRLRSLVFVLTALLATTRTAAPAAAQPQIPDKRLEGTWRVHVTVVDCTTGAAGPGFWSLGTFAQGGTATDTTSNQMLPGQRTAGHGVWHWQPPDTYQVATEAFLLFGPGLRPWTQRIAQRIVMVSGDEFVSEATVEFSLTPGSLPPPDIPVPSGPLCATARGYRF